MVYRQQQQRQQCCNAQAHAALLGWFISAYGRWHTACRRYTCNALKAGDGALYCPAGFINERDNSFPRQLFAFCIDGIAIVIGSLLGCAPLTVVIKSGIREGGRTGEVVVMCGVTH
jgi:hypothetical protein